MKTLKMITACLLIGLAAFLLIQVISSFIVAKYLMQTDWVRFTLYDGYANFSFIFIYGIISALVIFNRIRGNILLIATWLFALVLFFQFFILGIISAYFRFYVNTHQNGKYTFEVFKSTIYSQWDSLIFQFTDKGEILSFIIWHYIALLLVCYLSVEVKKYNNNYVIK